MTFSGLFFYYGAEFAFLHAGSALDAFFEIYPVDLLYFACDSICRAYSRACGAAYALVFEDVVAEKASTYL